MNQELAKILMLLMCLLATIEILADELDESGKRKIAKAIEEVLNNEGK